MSVYIKINFNKVNYNYIDQVFQWLAKDINHNFSASDIEGICIKFYNDEDAIVFKMKFRDIIVKQL